MTGAQELRLGARICDVIVCALVGLWLWVVLFGGFRIAFAGPRFRARAQRARSAPARQLLPEIHQPEIKSGGREDRGNRRQAQMRRRNPSSTFVLARRAD